MACDRQEVRRGGGRAKETGEQVNGGRTKKNNMFKSRSPLNIESKIINQGGKWRKWKFLPNLFQSQINEPNIRTVIDGGNIPSCYSTGGKLASHSGECGYFSEDISITDVWV